MDFSFLVLGVNTFAKKCHEHAKSLKNATILLEITPEQALARLDGTDGSSGRADDPDQARFEREPIEFHLRVAKGFRTLASLEPDQWFVVDASARTDSVADKVWSVVSNLLTLRGINGS